MAGSAASTEMVYAVRFGSSFEETICGSAKWAVREGGMGVQITPDE